MKIQADKEGMKAIHQLADVALKQGGIQNLDPVRLILSSCSLIEEDQKPDPKEAPAKEKLSVKK